MLTVYHNHKGYPEQRNILVSHPNIKHVQEYDIFKTLAHINFKLRKKVSTNLLNSHFNPFSLHKKNTIRHFFNGISYNRSPWVTTFETFVPRYTSPMLSSLGIKRLASKHCEKIIALSTCSYKIQLNYLKEHYPQHYCTIKEKMIVLHPPQKLIVNNIEQKSNIKALAGSNPQIVFTFVGNQFFGKGGREVLRVFKKLCAENPNITLNIISNFSPDSYASHTTQQDVQHLRQELSQLPENIKILGTISNEEVIKTLCHSHVALLPTYADTYGYFVLEAQACGCPVVTSDIRALPEINNNECGWLINVIKDENGNAILNTSEQRRIFSKEIMEQLAQIIEQIIKNPLEIIVKGKKAIKRIKNIHSPNQHANQLYKVYSNSVKEKI